MSVCAHTPALHLQWQQQSPVLQGEATPLTEGKWLNRSREVLMSWGVMHEFPAQDGSLEHSCPLCAAAREPVEASAFASQRR